MQQIIKAWLTLLPSNSPLVTKRAEQLQMLALGAILTYISPDDSEPLLVIICDGLLAASFCRFVCVCVHVLLVMGFEQGCESTHCFLLMKYFFKRLCILKCSKTLFFPSLFLRGMIKQTIDLPSATLTREGDVVT